MIKIKTHARNRWKWNMRFSNSNMFNMQTSNRYIVCVKLNLYAFFVWETRMRGNPLQWADQADGKICKYYCIMHTCSFNPELQSSNANINVVFGLYSNTLAIMWFVFIPSKPYFGVLNGNWYIRYSILGWMVSKGRRIKTMSCVFFCGRKNAILLIACALWQTLQWHFWIYNNNNNARSKAYCKLIPDVNPFSSHWFHVTVSFWLLWFGFVLYFPLCLSCYVYLIDYNALLFPRKMQIALKISNWGKNQHTQQKIYEINQ